MDRKLLIAVAVLAVIYRTTGQTSSTIAIMIMPSSSMSADGGSESDSATPSMEPSSSSDMHSGESSSSDMHSGESSSSDMHSGESSSSSDHVEATPTSTMPHIEPTSSSDVPTATPADDNTTTTEAATTTTTQAATTTAALQEHSFGSTMEFAVAYDSELSDNTSAAYQDLSDTFENATTIEFEKSVEYFKSVNVTGFSNGSTIVDFDIYFLLDMSNAADDFISVLKADTIDALETVAAVEAITSTLGAIIGSPSVSVGTVTCGENQVAQTDASGEQTGCADSEATQKAPISIVLILSLLVLSLFFKP